MFAEYEKGEHPILMFYATEVKFDVFLETALSLGADKVATGHYILDSFTNENGEEVYINFWLEKIITRSKLFLVSIGVKTTFKSTFPDW